jgi:urease accessory protein
VTEVTLAARARLVLRDGVVLGRTGERPGRLHARTRVTHGGRPLLDESLTTSASLVSEVVAGPARMVASCILAGTRDDEPPPGASQLHGLGTAWRGVGETAIVEAEAAAVVDRFAQVATDNDRAGGCR